MSYFKIVQDVDSGIYTVMSTNGSRSFEIAEFQTIEDARGYVDYQSADKKNISIYLPFPLIASLDEECQRKKIARSDIVRHVLEERYNYSNLFENSDLKEVWNHTVPRE